MVDVVGERHRCGAAGSDRLGRVVDTFRSWPHKQRCDDLVILGGIGGELDGDAQAVAVLVPFIGQAKDGCSFGLSWHLRTGRKNGAEFHISLIDLGLAPDHPPPRGGPLAAKQPTLPQSSYWST